MLLPNPRSLTRRHSPLASAFVALALASGCAPVDDTTDTATDEIINGTAVATSTQEGDK